MNSQVCIGMTEGIEGILAHLGLQEVMHDFERAQFDIYVPSDYAGSEREERDAVHRMAEIVLVHKHTGLRLLYLRSENYFGDEVRYKLVNIFIVGQVGKAEVLSVDFNNKIVVTNKGEVAFGQLFNDSFPRG